MRRFKWLEWNLQKIYAHALSREEVEASFDRATGMYEREDDSFLMNASTPSGRPIRVIWRFDRDPDEIPDVFGEVADDVIFVVTAYGGGN